MKKTKIDRKVKDEALSFTFTKLSSDIHALYSFTLMKLS